MAALRDLYVGITLDADPAIRELNRLNRAMDGSHSGFNQINSDTERTEESFNDLGRNGSNAFKSITKKASKFTAALGGIAGGLSGAVASAGPLVGAVGALGASFASAGIGAVAFGAVAGSVLKPVIEDAENLTEAQQKARDELEGFQSFWSDFTKQFETPIFEAFGKSLTLAQNVLKGFAPTITAVSGVVNKLLTEMNDAVNNGSLTGFFEWMKTTAADSLYNFAHIAGNTMGGFFNLLKVFAPLGTSMENGLLGLTQRFKEWTSSLKDSTAFQNFITYVQENGPKVLATIGNIVGIAKNLVTELAPLGTVVLSGIQNFTSAINEHWPLVKQTVIGLGVAVLTFKGIMMGMTIVSTITGLITGFRTALAAATAGQWGLNTAMWASPVTWVIAGIAALIAIGVLLWKNWDKVKAGAYALWTAIKFAWGQVKTKTAEVWDAVKTKIGNAMDSAKTKVTNFFSPLMSFIDTVKSKWNSLVGAFKNFKMPKIGMPKWLGGNGVIQTDGSHATGLYSVPKNGYTATLHKQESVLTAKQSNALRDAGILRNSRGKPVLNMEASSTASPASTGGNQITNHFSISVQGGNTSEETAYVVRREIEDFFASLNRVMPRVTEL
jgi:hypothetical protein